MYLHLWFCSNCDATKIVDRLKHVYFRHKMLHLVRKRHSSDASKNRQTEGFGTYAYPKYNFCTNALHGNKHVILNLLSLAWLDVFKMTTDSHYDDVIMSTIASQITSLTIVYSTIYLGADQSKHQSSASLAFVWGIHRGPVNSPHKWPVTRKMFPFDDVVMAAIMEISSK